MHRFFDAVVGPVLEIARPGVVVEIGSAAGNNTHRLLAFCEQTGAVLHVVDPDPGYDAESWERERGGALVFHRGLSFDALPRVERFDVVLIDGDHNWHTVHGELSLIWRLCKESGQPFPLILFHDVGWPYGRRDSYYEPERIPLEERRPHERKGMRPGVRELVEEGGMNQGFANATLEGEPKSGVLTAIEDFIEGADVSFRLLVLTGMNGLAVLVPQHLFGNEELAGFLDSLKPSPTLGRHLERVELAYLEAEIARQEAQAALRRAEAQHKNQIENLRRRLA